VQEKRKELAKQKKLLAEQQDAERIRRETEEAAETARRFEEKEEKDRKDMMANMNPAQKRMFLEHQAQLEKEKEVSLN
jgi:hypothetical protein